MTNEATRLAGCPFCEGACAVTKGYSTSELPWSGDGGDFFRVYCSKCQARQLFHRTEAEAVEAWNRRATLAQPAVSADARDAARYRWLRENACNYSDGYDGPQLAMRTHGPDWHAEIDAAIDAAMASQENPHD